ncbi:hypothetical protein BJX61DRAFT_513606 [Aspergillus egyptiacus]|nr:hypothetical protein BJX61DRAFT_513606 [Aspergillus egyptiacus]
MQPKTYLVSYLFLLLSTKLSTAQSDNPPCVEDCLRPMIYVCEGEETGEELDRCLCESENNAFDVVECIRLCSPEDQGVYAQSVPESCRDDLYPNATEPTESTESGGSGSDEPGDDAAGALKVPGLAVLGGLVVALMV